MFSRVVLCTGPPMARLLMRRSLIRDLFCDLRNVHATFVSLFEEKKVAQGHAPIEVNVRILRIPNIVEKACLSSALTCGEMKLPSYLSGWLVSF